VLWAEVQALKAGITLLEAQIQGPKQGSHNSSVPPSKTPEGNIPTVKPVRGLRQGSLGRAGVGRILHPEPDQTVIVQVKVCPRCEPEVAADSQKLHALYDKIENPPGLSVVTLVRQYGGQCHQCGQPYPAPVPVGLEPSGPYGTSVENLVSMAAKMSHQKRC
jgi:hypothetical protein